MNLIEFLRPPSTRPSPQGEGATRAASLAKQRRDWPKPGPDAGPVRAVAQQHGALLCDGRARLAAGREQGQRARARRLRLHGGHLAVPGGGRQEGGQGRRQKPAGEIILAQSFISPAASDRVRLFYFSPANNFVKKKNKFRLPQNFQWRFCPHD